MPLDLPAIGEPGPGWATKIIAALTELDRDKPEVVVHGDDPNVPRPVGATKVDWIGTVRPVNMTEADEWIGPEGLASGGTSANAPFVIRATAANTWPALSVIPSGFTGLVVFDSTPYPGSTAPPLLAGAHWLRRAA